MESECLIVFYNQYYVHNLGRVLMRLVKNALEESAEILTCDFLMRGTN